jgi:putative ABC transport system permease protein
MTLIRLAYHSICNRMFTSLLTVLAISVGVALLLGIEKIRVGARDSFSNAISQTDLIVGARTGSIQLLLYSVFHIGEPTNNISYASYLRFHKHKSTEWTIPYSLGDSHRGFRVVATNEDFYRHYKFRRSHGLAFAQGRAARDLFDVVAGATAAKDLSYLLGQKIVLSHGNSGLSGGIRHEDMPFKLVGVLEHTGTPIDRSFYITLEGMEAIHLDWRKGAPLASRTNPSSLNVANLKIKNITAFLLRTKTRIEALYLQREINEYKQEPLLAIIPGVALTELWQNIDYAEAGLRLVSIFVMVSGFIAMLIALYTSLENRRREVAILRALGAGPRQIIFLLTIESGLITVAGILFGLGLVYLTILAGRGSIEQQFGLLLPMQGLSTIEYYYLAGVMAAGLLMGVFPAWKAFRNSLSDGLSIRL